MDENAYSASMRLFSLSFGIVSRWLWSPMLNGRGMWRQFGMGCVCVLLGISLQACGTSGARYTESYTISNLNVVFLDEQSLRQQWKKISGKSGVEFVQNMNMTTPQVKTVKGFYDFRTHTVFCPKWDFEVCGHELHHAVLGQFHDAS